MVRAIRETVRQRRFVKRFLVGVPFLRFPATHNDWTIRTVKVAGEVRIRLDHTEVRHQLLEAPLVITPRCPCVVVLDHTSEEDLRINSAGTSHDLASRYQPRHRLVCVTSDEGPPMIAVGASPRPIGVTVPVLHLVRHLIEIRVVRPRFDQQY